MSEGIKLPEAKLFRDGKEIPINSLAKAVTKQMNSSRDELDQEVVDLMDFHTLTGIELVNIIRKDFEPVQALLVLAPYMEAWLTAMVTAGALMQRGLMKENNKLSIKVIREEKCEE